MSGVSELMRVCELKVGGALGELLWLVTTLLCERKDFRFCICVCRCASHVSSGYEPQSVFPMHASCESYVVPMYVSYEPDMLLQNLVSLMLLSLMLLRNLRCVALMLVS